jgi:hypothetical protein
MTEAEILTLLTSGEGRLVAAGLLFAVVALSKRAPWIGERLTNPWAKRAYVLILATLPTLALGLTTDASWEALGLTSATAALGAMGINSYRDGAPK